MSFARQFVIYGISGAASRLAAVVLVPLYTRTLSIAEYGQLEVLLAIHAVIVILAGMQLESAIARDYFEVEGAERDSHARGWWAIGLTAAGTAALTAIVLAVWWFAGLRGTSSATVVGLLLALTLPAQLLGVQLVMLRFQGRQLLYALVSLSDLALSALFSAGFIVLLDLGIAGALLGMLTGKLVCVALAWAGTFGLPPRARPDPALAGRMLRYGLPSIPAVLIGWAQNAGNRLVLALALTLEDVAIAGIAIKVAAIFGFVVYSYRLAWEPFSMAKLGSLDDDPNVYNRALDWYVPTMFLACGFAVLLGPHIGRVLAPQSYAAGGWIAMFFMLGQFWVGLTNVLVIGIHRARQTAQLLPVYGWGALLNIGLLFATAPFVGVAAAGIGFLAGSVCSAFVARHYSNRHLETPFNARLLGWTVLATALLALAWLVFASHGREAVGSLGAALLWLAGGLVVVMALVVMLVAGAFAPGQRADMWATLRAALRPATRPT